MFAKFRQGSKDLAMIYNSENSSLPEVLSSAEFTTQRHKGWLSARYSIRFSLACHMMPVGLGYLVN